MSTAVRKIGLSAQSGHPLIADTPREKHRRIRAYARAAKRALDSFTATGWDRSRELHAWNRLPLHVQGQIRRPQ